MGFIFWFGSLPPPYLVNSQVSPSILWLQHFSQHEHNAKFPITIEIYTSPPLALRLLSTDLPPLGLALSLSLEYIPLLLFRESKHIVVKYYMYLTLIVYWIFVNGLSNWNSILLTSWKIGVSGNSCFLGIFFFFLLAYSLICGGWAYDGVICVGHVLAVLGPWERDLEGGNIWIRYL